MTTPLSFFQLALCQVQHNTWHVSLSSARLTAPKPIIIRRWLTNNQCKRLHSFLLAEHLPTKKRGQGLSRCVSEFSSFMREHLDPVVKTDQRAQHVDDIDIPANNATDLIRNVRPVIKCVLLDRLELTKGKCHLDVKQCAFLRTIISPEGILTKARKIQNFLPKLRFPKSKKPLQR